MNSRSAPGKNSDYAAWKLELCSSSHNGPTTRNTALGGPLQCIVHAEGLADLNQNGPSKILILADDGLIYRTPKDSQEAVRAVQQQLASVSKWCHGTGSLISPEGYGSKAYWTTPPLPAALKCGARCYGLWTRPRNNGTDKSAKAEQSAERGNASHTVNRQGHTQWHHDVHARLAAAEASQTESGAGQSILQCRRKSSQLTLRSRDRHKSTQAWMSRFGWVKSWMGQAEDAILQVCQLTDSSRG